MPVCSTLEVSDFDLPELGWYRTLSRSGHHYREGVFVAEGEKVVPRLLETPLKVRSLLISRDWFRRLEAQLDAPEAASGEGGDVVAAVGLGWGFAGPRVLGRFEHGDLFHRLAVSQLGGFELLRGGGSPRIKFL